MVHGQDLAEGYGQVYLRLALNPKYPLADKGWKSQYVFPAGHRSTDPRFGEICRHHLDPSPINKAIAKAIRPTGIRKAGQCAYVPAQLRHTSPATRYGHSHHPGPAGTRARQHHHDLHPRPAARRPRSHEPTGRPRHRVLTPSHPRSSSAVSHRDGYGALAHGPRRVARDVRCDEPAALDQEISLGRRIRCVRSIVSVSAMSAWRGAHRFARAYVRTKFLNRAIERSRTGALNPRRRGDTRHRSSRFLRCKLQRGIGTPPCQPSSRAA